jgi:hypothetical protein
VGALLRPLHRSLLLHSTTLFLVPVPASLIEQFALLRVEFGGQFNSRGPICQWMEDVFVSDLVS